jgi:hypothetical protein
MAWKLPPGWTEAPPGELSVAGFKLPSEGGQANVSITPLPDLSGREADIVGMWREQAGAPILSPEEAEASLKPIELAGASGKFFEVEGTRDGKPMHIVTAMLNRADGTWFFKLQGDDPAVTNQKPAFLEFLKSVRFEDVVPAADELAKTGNAERTSGDSPASAAEPKTPSTPPAAPPSLEAPDGWRTLPAGQMQIAKYAVPDQGDAKAEVAVSMFSSDTGGPTANIARWRRQMSLPEASDEEVGAMAKPLDSSLPGAILAELKNEKRRMLGAIVPRASGWWFYKLVGDEAAVTAARDSFLNFVKSQPKS